MPKTGTKFLHKRIVGADGMKAVCIVSAVRDGVIYYKVEGERKSKEYVTQERWPKIAEVHDE